MCNELIRRHILQLPKNTMFTSREMLVHGSRSAVDCALSRMVKNGVISRLARGVFIRDVSELPSAFEIANVKVRGFGVGIFGSNEEVLKKLPGFKEDGSSHVFAIQGSSTKFWTIHGVVSLQSTCGRKFALPETTQKKVAYQLWNLGRQGGHSEPIRAVTS